LATEVTVMLPFISEIHLRKIQALSEKSDRIVFMEDGKLVAKNPEA
jgi:hypothetical protein